jgi:hypothetical protein
MLASKDFSILGALIKLFGIFFILTTGSPRLISENEAYCLVASPIVSPAAKRSNDLFACSHPSHFSSEIFSKPHSNDS